METYPGYITKNSGSSTEEKAEIKIREKIIGSLTVGYQKKVPAGRIKPAFFVSNFWFLSIVFYCNVL